MSDLMTSMLYPEGKMYSRKAMEPKIRKDAKRFKVQYGPVELLGKDMPKPILTKFSNDPNGQSFIHVFKEGLCTNCTILGGRVGVTYEDGTEVSPATGVYIHHLLTYDISKKAKNPIAICDVQDHKNPGLLNWLMGTDQPMSTFIGRGEDNGILDNLYTSPNGDFNAGFHVSGSGHQFLAQTDLVNYNADTKKVFVTIEFEYINGIQGADSVSGLLSVTGKSPITTIIAAQVCLGCRLEAPKVNMTGRAETKSLRFPVLLDSHILFAKGHLHNGGDSMMLYVNDKLVCTSVPEYKDDVIVSMTTCEKPIPLKKGDYVSMASVYDVVKHPL